MIKLKPPTHQIDGLAVFVSGHDPAWDMERIAAERQAQLDRAVFTVEGGTAAERAKAVALAPVERYYAGKTRYQLDAPDWGADGQPTTARAFLKPGEKPAEFGLRRLGYRAFQQLAEVEDSRGRLIEACRLGLRSITADGYRWRATGEATATDEQLEVLHAASPELVVEIGAAVIVLARSLDPEAEGPR